MRVSTSLLRNKFMRQITLRPFFPVFLAIFAYNPSILFNTPSAIIVPNPIIIKPAIPIIYVLMPPLLYIIGLCQGTIQSKSA